MRNTTRYEWVIETLDGPDGPDAEIAEVNHADTYAEAVAFAKDIPHYRIGLVRDTGNDQDGLDTRAWAYIEDGVLPVNMLDAFERVVIHVPVKWREQFEKGA